MCSSQRHQKAGKDPFLLEGQSTQPCVTTLKTFNRLFFLKIISHKWSKLGHRNSWSFNGFISWVTWCCSGWHHCLTAWTSWVCPLASETFMFVWVLSYSLTVRRHAYRVNWWFYIGCRCEWLSCVSCPMVALIGSIPTMTLYWISGKK